MFTRRILVLILLVLGGCLDQVNLTGTDSTARNDNNNDNSKSGDPPSIATTQIFKARWDGWLRRIAVSSNPCSVNDFAPPDTTCLRIKVGRWETQALGRTFGSWDFNTTSIPNDAIIQSASLTLRVQNATEFDAPDSPPIVTCGTDPGSGDLHLSIGLYARPVKRIGMAPVDSVPNYMYTECLCCGLPNQWNADAGQGTNVVLTPNLNSISKENITRFLIDSEQAGLDKYVLFSFYSMRGGVNKAAELRVTWRPTFEYYGATLGDAAWAGFDTVLTPDLGSSLSYERLDETLPVYLVWKNADGTGMQQLSQPTRIDQMSWWGSSGFTALDFTANAFLTFDQEYHPCPAGVGLDQVTLNSDGTLTVKDLNFGGVGTKTRIELRAEDPAPEKSIVRVVVLQWDNPGTHFDVALAQNVDATPGAVVTMQENIELVPGSSFPIRLPTIIVEWVSTDAAGITPRVVNSEDLAALSPEIDNPVRWGFGSETRNYHVNFNPFASSANYIDSSDLSSIAGDINNDNCGTSKPVAGDRTRMLAWFGIGATGRMVPVGPDGALAPEYSVLDREQNRRAIADPEGWRRLAVGSVLTDASTPEEER